MARDERGYCLPGCGAAPYDPCICAELDSPMARAQLLIIESELLVMECTAQRQRSQTLQLRDQALSEQAWFLLVQRQLIWEGLQRGRRPPREMDEDRIGMAAGSACPTCQGDGMCRDCRGNGTYLVPGRARLCVCPRCAQSGNCAGCQGTGQEPMR